MNNKGFAVSSVLYAILISFLLFLGVALAMFSSANNITLSANDDIVNGTGFSARRVVNNMLDSNKNEIQSCDNNGNWTNVSDRLIKINSRYGVVYWPKDFGTNGKMYSNKISASGALVNNYNINNYTIEFKNYDDYNSGKDITFKDVISENTTTVRFYNVCK